MLNEQEDPSPPRRSTRGDPRRGMRIAGGISIGLLVKGEYEVLEAMTSGRHLSAREIQGAVEELGAPLVDTPDWEWSHLALTPSTGAGPPGFDFVVPLWVTDGRSGLGMRMHLIPTTYGTFEVELEGFVPVDANALPAEPLSGSSTLPIRSASVDRGNGQPSDSPVPERWRPALGAIGHRLVIGDYAGLAADGLISFTDDPTNVSIERWIEDYPAHLVDLPAEAWAYSEHGAWVNEPGSWWVIVDLWTAEEGRSDLSMEATVWDDGTSIVAKLDNVHVM